MSNRNTNKYGSFGPFFEIERNTGTPIFNPKQNDQNIEPGVPTETVRDENILLARILELTDKYNELNDQNKELEGMVNDFDSTLAFFIQRGESEPEVKKGLWLDESVEGVGVDDVIVIKGTDLQVVGNVSGQIPVLQDLIVKGAEINLIEGSSGEIQISGGEITIVNAEGVEETLIDETLTVSSVDMVSGTKYITIENVIPII